MECKGIEQSYPEHQFLIVSCRFRWVFCQLDALRHCFPPNLRQYLNELPDSLDETYERILKGINKAQRDNAHRLLRCLTVAVRPLHVQELAELLAFDFQASTEGGIPTLKEDWRWDDQEEAILSTCSSLITIIPRYDSRLVQFSHFSVKEYLTSSRLAKSLHEEVSRFRIDLEPANTIMAQACLATLLQLDEHAGISDAKLSPLGKYAAEHWVNHAQFEKVSSHMRDGMDDLFDSSKPHFAAWVRVHDIDKPWETSSSGPLWVQWGRGGVGSPLYYAAFCGFYDLAERLVTKHPVQTNAFGGYNLFPFLAALSKKHFRIANLLYQHGAVVDAQCRDAGTPLHAASHHGQVDIMRWLINNGADTNARDSAGFTPLCNAVDKLYFEPVRLLLEHNADINAMNFMGWTSLQWILAHCSSKEKFVDMVRLLLEHGADPNICTNRHKAPLHEASSRGLVEAARLLLSHGAKVDGKDGEGRTPFQLAASEGHDELMDLLVEHGAVPPNEP